MEHLPENMTSTQEILEASTLMLLDKNNMTRQYIDDYLSKNQIQTKDYIEISNMDLLIEFAKIGVGVACVIKNFVQDELKAVSCSKFHSTSLSISATLVSPIRKRTYRTVHWKVSLLSAVRKVVLPGAASPHAHSSPTSATTDRRINFGAG